MKKLNSLFENFYKKGKDARVKFCLKILRRLVKNSSLLIWFPIEQSTKIFYDYKDFKDYYARFRSEIGMDFIITLNLAGEISDDYIRYEFGIEIVGENSDYYVELGHIIHRIDNDHSTRTVVMGELGELPVKYGYLIMKLYNKIASQLQLLVAQNKLKDALKETLEALKIQTI